MTARRTYDPAELDAIRAREPLSAIIGQTVNLQRRGKEWLGLCPFHKEKTPSFTVRDDKRFFHCFGCEAHGDLFEWFQLMRPGLSFPDAVRLAGGGRDVSERDKAAARRRRDEQAARSRDDIAQRRAWARALWQEARPIERTPGERYLRGRGIICPLPPKLRFHPRCYHAHASGPNQPGRRPAVICAIQNPALKLVAVHRIYVGEDGGAAVDLPKHQRKMALGDYTGCVIMLSPPAPRTIATEGVEDALSYVDAGRAAGRDYEVWAAVSSGNFKNIVWPPTSERYIAGDGDETGRRKAQRAIDELALYGETRLPKLIQLPRGQDPNSIMQGAQPCETMSAWL